MNKRTLVVGFLIVFSLWVVLPYLFALTGSYFGWPIINNYFLKIFGLILIVLAILNDLYLLFMFNKFGGGTPVPTDPSSRVISKGQYKYTRNPMYLGHMVLIFGEFLLFGYLGIFVYWLLLMLGLHILVVKWEEPDLKERLGNDYIEYIKKTRRWL